MDDKFSLEFLLNLRALFRQDFEKHDYCIGQECVEKLFRDLLNEPTPISNPNQPLTYSQASTIFNESLPKFIEKFANVMNTDDNFFKKIK